MGSAESEYEQQGQPRTLAIGLTRKKTAFSLNGEAYLLTKNLLWVIPY
jgi:hypothetical protein